MKNSTTPLSRRAHLAYHVTPAENLSNILACGLEPRMGERSTLKGEKSAATYLFNSLPAVQDGLCNWLGDHFDEDQELLILVVDIDEIERAEYNTASYEIVIRETIEAGRILLILDEQLRPSMALDNPAYASCDPLSPAP